MINKLLNKFGYYKKPEVHYPKAVMICHDYRMFLNVCAMYGLNYREVRFAGSPDDLRGIAEQTPVYTYYPLPRWYFESDMQHYLKAKTIKTIELDEVMPKGF